MQPRDLMYALHIVSLHLHNNRHAQNFFYLGPYDPNSVLFSKVNLDWYHSHLFTTQVIDFLPQAQFLLAIASACALF